MFDWLKGDPEQIRVAEKLSKQLDNIDDWKDDDGEYIRHKIHNIRIRKDRISSPEHMWIPFWWQGRIKKKIKKIYRKYEIERLSFICDNLDGKYYLYLHNLSNEQKAWFKENATEDQYINRDGIIYISDATLAMAYKLQWM